MLNYNLEKKRQQQIQQQKLKNYKFKVRSNRQKRFSDTISKKSSIILTNDNKTNKINIKQTKKLNTLIENYKNKIVDKNIPLQLQKDLYQLSKNINIRYK